MRRLQQEVSAREYAEWMAYLEVEPTAADRLEAGLGVLTYLVARGLGAKGVAETAFYPSRLIQELRLVQQGKALRRQQSQQQMAALLNIWRAGVDSKFGKPPGAE